MLLWEDVVVKERKTGETAKLLMDSCVEELFGGQHWDGWGRSTPVPLVSIAPPSGDLQLSYVLLLLIFVFSSKC